MIRPLSLIPAAALWLLCLSVVPAAAQGGAADALPDGRPNESKVGVQVGFLKYGGFSSDGGVDVTYNTRTLTGPVSPAGFRFGLAGAFGLQRFGDDGGTLKLFQAGVHMTADKYLGSPQLPLYGNVLFGAGSFFGSTDTFLTLAVGADFPVESLPFKIRVEIAQVWDIYDGGADAGWRFAGGIALPLP